MNLNLLLKGLFNSKTAEVIAHEGGDVAKEGIRSRLKKHVSDNAIAYIVAFFLGLSLVFAVASSNSELAKILIEALQGL